MHTATYLELHVHSDGIIHNGHTATCGRAGTLLHQRHLTACRQAGNVTRQLLQHLNKPAAVTAAATAADGHVDCWPLLCKAVVCAQLADGPHNGLCLLVLLVQGRVGPALNSCGVGGQHNGGDGGLQDRGARQEVQCRGGLRANAGRAHYSHLVHLVQEEDKVALSLCKASQGRNHHAVQLQLQSVTAEE